MRKCCKCRDFFFICPFFFPFFAGLFLVKLEVKSSPHLQPPRQHGLPVPPHSTPTPRRLHHQVDRNSIPMQACTLGTHSSSTTNLNRQLSLALLSQTSPGLLNVRVHNFCIRSWIHVYNTQQHAHVLLRTLCSLPQCSISTQHSQSENVSLMARSSQYGTTHTDQPRSTYNTTIVCLNWERLVKQSRRSLLQPHCPRPPL